MTADVTKALEGVTPGPWMVGGVRGKLDRQSVHFIMRYDEEKKRDEQICAVWYEDETSLGLQDARFIAWCREGVPALAAELAAQTDRADALAADLGFMTENRDLFRDAAQVERARAEAAEAERDAAQTDLGKVIMTPPTGRGMRAAGAVEGVKMLRAACDTGGAKVTDLTAKLEAAQSALERDRTLVADTINGVQWEIRGREWLLEGRGCYEWDDDRYRDEFAQALAAIRGPIDKLKGIAADWANCPTDPAKIQEARAALKAGGA